MGTLKTTKTAKTTRRKIRTWTWRWWRRTMATTKWRWWRSWWRKDELTGVRRIGGGITAAGRVEQPRLLNNISFAAMDDQVERDDDADSSDGDGDVGDDADSSDGDGDIGDDAEKEDDGNVGDDADSSDGNVDVGDDADSSPALVDDLPEGHLFRLIHRAFLWDDENDTFADFRRPVDWDAVSSRLETAEGQREARQWVQTGRSAKRLFLHELCDFDLGSEEEISMISLCIDGPTSMRILRKIVDVCPESVRLPDGEGCYPLHIVCDRNLYHDDGVNSTHLKWRQTTRDAFDILYNSYPEAVSLMNTQNNRTALHCVVQAGDTEDQMATLVQERLFRFLLDKIPLALGVSDADGRCPLHIACDYFRKREVIEAMLRRNPLAAQLQCKEGRWGGRTPLLAYLRLCYANEGKDPDISYKVAEMLLDSCPWAAGMDDTEVLMIWAEDLVPAGDALDYISVALCDQASVNWPSFNWEEFEEWPIPYISSYILANAHVLGFGDGRNEADEASWDGQYRDDAWAERIIEFFVSVLRVLYGQEIFLPLHAAVQGRLCRPWHLIALYVLLNQYRGDAMVRDRNGNLPLHLFLESCMLQRSRAMLKGYAGDFDDYDRAVTLSFRLLFEAYPGAASETSGDGRLPLHLAIENCSHLPFCSMMGPLLQQEPRALISRDIETKLYPFASAAVGALANLDLSFMLLRKEPSVLTIFS